MPKVFEDKKIEIKLKLFQNKNNQIGQTLLFVIVAVSIALAVGVSVSTRALLSSKRVSRTDTASLVIAASEGGLERLLSLPSSILDSLESPSPSTCESAGAQYDSNEGKCVYNFTAENKKCLRWECKTCQCGTQRVCTTSYRSCCPNDSCKYLCSRQVCRYVCDYYPYPPGGSSCYNRCTYETGCCSSPCSSSYCSFCGSRQQCPYQTCQDVPYDCADCNKCGWDCLEEDVRFSDRVESRAIVEVKKFRTNDQINNQGYYWFNLKPGHVKEVNLSGYTSSSTIRLCWDNDRSAVYYISYNSSGDIKKGGLVISGSPNASNVSGFTSAQTSGLPSGYKGCRDISLVNNPYGLRVKVLYESSKVAVFPSSPDSFPYQGHLIVSKGFLSTEAGESHTKVIRLYRSHPYAPSVFDYGLYTPDVLN